MKKSIGPNPCSYENGSDIFNKVISRNEGAFSMARSERKFNFAKFNSMHSVLV